MTQILYMMTQNDHQSCTVGDLNEGASGKDIFLELHRKGGGGMGPLYLSEDSACFGGYSRAVDSAGLNGDLNQGAGGKDIFLCLVDSLSTKGVRGLKLIQSPYCGAGWHRVSQVASLNGDLNQVRWSTVHIGHRSWKCGSTVLFWIGCWGT